MTRMTQKFVFTSNFKPQREKGKTFKNKRNSFYKLVLSWSGRDFWFPFNFVLFLRNFPKPHLNRLTDLLTIPKNINIIRDASISHG